MTDIDALISRKDKATVRFWFKIAKKIGVSWEDMAVRAREKAHQGLRELPGLKDSGATEDELVAWLRDQWMKL